MQEFPFSIIFEKICYHRLSCFLKQDYLYIILNVVQEWWDCVND